MKIANRLLTSLRDSPGLAVLVLTALVCGTTQSAIAQQAASPAPAVGLEEIIVTAQKRAQNSQDVGIALSAVTGDGPRQSRRGLRKRHHQGHAGGGADATQRPGVIQSFHPRRHAERLR